MSVSPAAFAVSGTQGSWRSFEMSAINRTRCCWSASEQAGARVLQRGEAHEAGPALSVALGYSPDSS